MTRLHDTLQRLLPYRRPVIVAAHLVLAIVAYLLAFLLHFEAPLLTDYWTLWIQTAPLVLLFRGAVFAWCHLYEGLWRYVSMRDILSILKAVTLSSIVLAAAVFGIVGWSFPWRILILDWVFCLALVGGVRLALRTVRETGGRYRRVLPKRAIVVGAGDAGEMLAREIERNPLLNYRIVGFIDDDPKKQGRRIHGIKVVGAVSQLVDLSRSDGIQEILIAIPSATRVQKSRILAQCRRSGVTFRTIPALDALLQGKARIGELQEVKPEDLLGREAVQVAADQVRSELRGRRILVTGAAGSIGSELCRQLVPFQPELLILLDRAESGLFFIDLELRRLDSSQKIVPVVGDIRDLPRLEEVIQAYGPEVVYHAAAYKHVPLMEEHPLEGITNNVFGTETVALAGLQGGVKKFVFISTDKAVRPVGVMGMTKRVAEGLLRLYGGGSTTFVTVRFGNVLGSDGSVLPLFKWQMAHGGPITVTDPDASRYFMLLSEAAQLVLQTGVIGRGDEVFFLDMGEPIKILDLAHNLVQLSGLEPGKDIEIQVIGLRPGERLTESLVMTGEELLRTEHEKIYRVRNHMPDVEAFGEDLGQLRCLVAARDRDGAVDQLRAMAARY